MENVRIHEVKDLFKAIAISAAFALLGGLLVGDALGGWFQDLEQPWYALPLWGWGVIGGLYYIMTTALLYRLFHRPPARNGRLLFIMTLVMMAANEGWNYLLFGLESTLSGLVGLIPFAALVVVLFVMFVRTDRVLAWILSPYVVWLAYDLWWIYGLWNLNR